ncbi:VOC family protein [Nocardioides sp. YIM 152588]|uniref:VOC family protein n=1 Tax=Nocardioides sp. YIM 152588 TaxID=3158259 RepID=UPI0032E4CE86
MTSSATPVTGFIAFTIDSPDAVRSAEFYAALMGGEVTGRYPEYGYAQMQALDTTLNFQSVADYGRPEWPGQAHPQQFHLDLRVGDLESATAHAVSLGAEVAAEQPEGATWRVMIDPDGHPFCLCPPSEA